MSSTFTSLLIQSSQPCTALTRVGPFQLTSGFSAVAEKGHSMQAVPPEVFLLMPGSSSSTASSPPCKTLSTSPCRMFPPEELDAMDYMLKLVFTCSMSQMPPAALLHKFWTQFTIEMNISPYSKCLKSNGIESPGKTLDFCRYHCLIRSPHIDCMCTVYIPASLQDIHTLHLQRSF